MSLCLQQLCAATQLNAGCNVNCGVCPSDSIDFFKRQNDGGAGTAGAAHREHWLPQAAASLMPARCMDCTYTYRRPEHSVSQTSFRCGLTDPITIRSWCIYTSHWHASFLIWITYWYTSHFNGVNGVYVFHTQLHLKLLKQNNSKNVERWHNTAHNIIQCFFCFVFLLWQHEYSVYHHQCGPDDQWASIFLL